MDALLIAVIAVIVVALATALAPRVGIAGPLLLVAIGLGVSLLPFVPAIEIDPEIILVGVLPPLLYSSAVSLPALEFRRDFGPIAGLSVLLVVGSAVVLGLFFNAVIPGLGLGLAIALGAILSPTDAVATSIVKRLGISPRVVTMLEGESLLNDATSLVILRSAIAAVAVGLEPGEVLGTFAWGVLLAVVIGGLVGWINLRVRAWVANSAANTALSFVVPFLAYLPTEHLGGSGLVAAVVAGIVTGQGAARWFTPEQRMSDELNWRTIELMLEGAVFLIMGLELKELLRANVEDHQGLGHALWLAAVALAIVLAVRAAYVSVLVWVQGLRSPDRQQQRLDAFGERLGTVESSVAQRWDAPPPQVERRMGSLRRRLSRALADLDYYRSSPLGWRHGTIIVWAGMRGVVTLAAAQTLPRDTEDRPLLVLVAFIVAVGSLMLQGFTLPWLVRAVGLSGSAEARLNPVEVGEIEQQLRSAAAAAIPDMRRRDGSDFPPELIEAAGARYTAELDDDTTERARELLELRLATIAVMRAKLITLQRGGRYSTSALRHALAELDADELHVQLRLRDED